MEAVYKYYKPAWRSFYAKILLMLLLVVIGCAVNYYKPGENWLKLMWIAIAVVDVLIFLHIAIQRSTMSLILRDNPSKPEDQEVAFIVCKPLKPFSSDFRRVVEISLRNIEHVEFVQNLFQTILRTGDVIVTSSGTSGQEIRAKDIPNPQAVCDEIEIHAHKYNSNGNPPSTLNPIFPSRDDGVTAVAP